MSLSGCQVGGHVKKGGKEDIFTRKGGHFLPKINTN